MSDIFWDLDGKVMVMSAERSLKGVIERVMKERPAWVVLMRSDKWTIRPRMYAFRPKELLFIEMSKRWLPAQEALDLHETDESPPEGDIEALLWPEHATLPSATRVVRLDDDGVLLAVGQRLPLLAGVPLDGVMHGSGDEWRGDDSESGGGGGFGDLFDDDLGLGPVRSNRGSETRGEMAEPPRNAAETVEAQLTARAPSQIAVGQEAAIKVTIELASEALPFEGEKVTTRVLKEEEKEITAIISVAGTAVEALKPDVLKLKPPRENKPSFGSFVVRGLAPGRAYVAVMFHQAGSELGTLTMSLNVAASDQAAAPSPGTVEVKTAAAPPEGGDDEGLVLLIDEVERGGTVCYRYRVVSDALGLDYADFSSKALEVIEGGSASTARAYVESIYKQLTERVLRNMDDVENFAREMRAIGGDLSRQLIPDDLARTLWQHRAKIGGVLVRSWEPFVPWELLRLRNPDSQRTELDDRFLAEYNLVRSLNGQTRPRRLALRDWSYVEAKYEHAYAKQVGAEVEFLKEALPRDYNIQPTAIAPAIDKVLDALNRPGFDVLHIACHGEASHDDIARSSLIIGDRPGEQNQPQPVAIDSRTVSVEAELWERTPLVFLNACESGRLGASLTEWGGWPKTFWDCGAGAFVGTSWPVREKPARVFAETFYKSLLGGRTLAQAAGDARAAAKELKDASWLAYKVYGQPNARKS
jgi:hypothetical protein